MARVFVVTSVHGRYDVRVFLKQCCSIASIGHDVALVVQDGKGNENRDGVNIIDLGNPPPDRVRRIFLSPWRMYRFLRAVSPDIVHFHDPELLPLGYLLKRGNHFVIYDSHEDFPRQVLTKHWISPVFRKMISFLFEIFENYIVKRLDAVVCATPFIAKRFKLINPNCVDVNNFPILAEYLPLSDRKSQPFSRTICYIGAITRERGISELVDAIYLLQNVTLIVCGPFESQVYEDELKAKPGWRYVDYRGIVGRTEVAKIMSDSVVGIVTFLPGPNHNDSQPNKMFEYMSAGLPLIASFFPLWRQIIENSNCGLCVDPSSPQEIADAIEKLLSNELMCRQMGAAGRQAVAERFNWSNEAEKLLELYRNALK